MCIFPAQFRYHLLHQVSPGHLLVTLQTPLKALSTCAVHQGITQHIVFKVDGKTQYFLNFQKCHRSVTITNYNKNELVENIQNTTPTLFIVIFSGHKVTIQLL